MFETLTAAPPDPILGLTEAFKKDRNPQKINLGVGVFKDDEGKTPTLACVREAERRLLEADAPKTYLAIAGSEQYARVVQHLLFGGDHPIVAEARAVSAQTPGGTGALRVLADFIKANAAGARLWLSEPTWANHPKVFGAAGLELRSYAYYDPRTHGLDFERMLHALKEAGPGDVVLFHVCCHNPSGVDPSPEQWTELAQLCERQGFLPLFDFAYQGFGDGIEPDARGLRAFAERSGELLVASSFSKNFGLYNERVGALTLVGRSAPQTQAAFSQLQVTIRSNYSNPPAHGGRIVTTVLEDPALRQQWVDEVAAMRERIRAMRQAFVDGLTAVGVTQDFSFIINQRGMFSFSGLTRDQVRALRDEYSIYIVDSGRINVAGITSENLLRLCRAIREVL